MEVHDWLLHNKSSVESLIKRQYKKVRTFRKMRSLLGPSNDYFYGEGILWCNLNVIQWVQLKIYASDL